ncbi:hypothetical protein CFP56_003904 [Quercus suber]|uniref:Uncharacterized protein n=1 Tax=Quercus suber TaxID=58331 RepID=A0AAW0LDJ6_QUESU
MGMRNLKRFMSHWLYFPTMGMNIINQTKSSGILVPITNNGNEEMETTMIINILPQTKENVVAASVEDKLKILASCNVVEDTYNLKLVS